jgi:hypothetical protein
MLLPFNIQVCPNFNVLAAKLILNLNSNIVAHWHFFFLVLLSSPLSRLIFTCLNSHYFSGKLSQVMEGHIFLSDRSLFFLAFGWCTVLMAA